MEADSNAETVRMNEEIVKNLARDSNSGLVKRCDVPFVWRTREYYTEIISKLMKQCDAKDVIIAELTKERGALVEKIRELVNYVAQLEFAPGGVGAIAAQKDFEQRRE